jgi:hypothetical protein
MYSQLINRQRTDNDPSFQVSITGFSRVRWSLVMQALNDWLSENNNSSNDNAECAAAVKDILKAIESHVVDNSDGYSVASKDAPRPTSDRENDALRNARTRRREELKAITERAKSLGFDKRKTRKKCETTSA